MAKIPAAAPMAAPRASWVSFAVTSTLASSISSRTRSWARSETSWIAWAMLVLSPCAASWRARISSVLMAMSVPSEMPQDERGHEPAGEGGADEDLRAVGRDAEGQLVRLVLRNRRVRRRGRDDGHGRRRLRRGARRRRAVAVVGHSGGSSPKARRQMTAASFVVATEASAPMPASSPAQISRLTTSLSMGRDPRSRTSGCAVQPAADGFDDVHLRLLVLVVATRQDVEDPPGQHLLDRAVERHRGELGRHRRAERPLGLRALDDRADELVRLADLGQVRPPERVRRARDLDDDDLHQVGVVAVGVDDERRDRVELLARRAVGRVELADDLEQDVPALEEERVEDLVLRAEVVVDQPEGDARLVGDVRDPAAVEALPGEDPHGGV